MLPTFANMETASLRRPRTRLILPGGDLYDIESKWFSLTDSRPDTYVTDWLKTVNCPVIRIDGTLPVENNLDYLVSVLSEGVK